MEFFATSNSIPVHISDSRSGNVPVVFLHGYLETMYIWEEFLPLLKSEFRTITVDLPGHGLSGSFIMNTIELVADVISDVLKICNVESAYVVGHSMGGYAALSFAKKYDQQCRGVVLLGSSPYADPEDKSSDRMREIEIVRADKLVHLAQSSIPKMYAHSNLRRLDNKVQETIELCETHDPEGIVSSIKGLMRRPDMTDFVRDYGKKMIMVFGDSDKIMDLEGVEKMKAEFPKAEFHVLKDTGHNSFIESPKETAGIINGLL